MTPRAFVKEGLKLGLDLALSPVVVGALVMLLRVALSSRGASEGLGAEEQRIAAFVEVQYRAEISRTTWAIVAMALAWGALLGAMAAVLFRVRRWTLGHKGGAPRLDALWAVPFVWTFGLLLEVGCMARAPQLYAQAYYARGGISRLVQVVATDFLGPAGVTFLTGFALLLFALGPSPRAIQRGREIVAKFRTLSPKFAAPWLVPGALSAGALALLVGGCRGRTHAVRPPNVLLLAADSFRADRLSARVTPTLWELRQRATSFDRTYVSLPRTFPSWVTLLTGRHPHHHGIRSMFPRWEDRTKDFDALPKRLSAAGYQTGVVSDFAGDIFRRIDLGFGAVETPTFNMREMVRQRALERQTPLFPALHSRWGRKVFPVLREIPHAADPFMLTDDAMDAVDAMGNGPFFLTVFYGAAHFPYASPAPYYDTFSRGGYRGPYKYHKPVSIGGEAKPEKEDVEQIRALYDGALHSVDAAMAKLLRGLGKRGLLDNTIIVVTGDHGEMLFERGNEQGHGDFLFGDEALHVPLLIARPGASGGNVASVARDVDLAPTLYALLGVAPPQDLDGRSLVAALRGEPLASEHAFAETGLWFSEEIPGLDSSLRMPYPPISRITELDPDHGHEVVLRREMKETTTVAKHRMVRDERYKLVYVPTRRGAKYVLFDTATDPRETKDVSSEEPRVLARLKKELWAWMKKDKEMTERGGLLVPALVEGHFGDRGIRLDAADEPPEEALP